MTANNPSTKEDYVTAGDIRVAYSEIPADKPPMVLLHGIGMDRRVWQAVSRRLAPHFRLFMPDLRGHGASSHPEAGYSLAHFALDIEYFLQILELSPVLLVGSSLGGMVAAVIEAPPEQVLGRVLVDPPLRRGSGPLRPLLADLLEIKRMHPDGDEQKPLIMKALESDNPRIGRQYLHYMTETWSQTASGVINEALNPVETNTQIDDALRHLDAPTLLMRADPARGGVLPEDQANHALSLLPMGKLIYYPNAGHAIHGSDPIKFTEDILSFSSELWPDES